MPFACLIFLSAWCFSVFHHVRDWNCLVSLSQDNWKYCTAMHLMIELSRTTLKAENIFPTLCSQLFRPRSSVTYRRKISVATSIRFIPSRSWFCPASWSGRKYRLSSVSPKHRNSLATCRHRVFIWSVSSTFASSPFALLQGASRIIIMCSQKQERSWSEVYTAATYVVGSVDNLRCWNTITKTRQKLVQSTTYLSYSIITLICLGNV